MTNNNIMFTCGFLSKIVKKCVCIFSVCVGNTIPSVPRDNSHYVEGESRYIWMSEDEGVPILVDLNATVDEAALASRSGANNEYWLYTR